MAKVLSGEMFIVSYQDAGVVNRWAINNSKTAIEAVIGHQVKTGITDILLESSDPAVEFKNNRASFPNDGRVTFLKDAGYRDQAFGGKTLKVLKVLNATDIFNTSGTKIGTIPAGTEIGIIDGDSGNSMKHLLAVTAYDSKDGLGWRYINQSTYTSGFINVQQGFGLTMYNSTRAIVTPRNEIQNIINWNDVKAVQAGKTAELEAYLRSIPSVDTKPQVEKAVNDYFASIDLSKESLGDPEQYFSNLKNFDFILTCLESAGFTETANLFDAEQAYFINKV